MNLYEKMTFLGRRVDFEESLTLSRKLGNLVRGDYSPEIIVGIAEGGLVPSIEVAREIGINWKSLTVKRGMDLREKYETSSKFGKLFLKVYQEYLFMTLSPVVKEGENLSYEGLRVLAVDDTVHTGKTLRLVKKVLLSNGAREVRFASINYLSTAVPDYFIKKERLKFPWSKDSLQYEMFEEYVRNNTLIHAKN